MSTRIKTLSTFALFLTAACGAIIWTGCDKERITPPSAASSTPVNAGGDRGPTTYDFGNNCPVAVAVTAYFATTCTVTTPTAVGPVTIAPGTSNTFTAPSGLTTLNKVEVHIGAAVGTLFCGFPGGPLLIPCSSCPTGRAAFTSSSAQGRLSCQ